MRRYIATFLPQAWVSKQAITVDAPGPATWDATAFVRAKMTRSERGDAIAGLTRDLDLLRDDPNAPVWVQEWDGPFECSLELDQIPLADVLASKQASASASEKGLTLDQLRERHGGNWGEHPEHPVADWRAEVANEDTRRGYWEWVEAEIEA